METTREVIVRAELVSSDKETLKKLKKMGDHLKTRYFFIDYIDCKIGDDDIEIIGSADADSDWAYIPDQYSSSGTRGGLVKGFGEAKEEIEDFMKQLYEKDIIEDWEYKEPLPDKYEVA